MDRLRDSEPRTHYRTSQDGRTECGMPVSQFMTCSADVDAITCRSCRWRIERRRQVEEMVRDARPTDPPRRAPSPRPRPTTSRRRVDSTPAKAADNPWQNAHRIIHYRPMGWAATACRLSALKCPALVSTIDPHQVDCRKCLGLMRGAIGDGALHADAIREITAITLDIATKRDIADLKAYLETELRRIVADLKEKTISRTMTVEECADYIRRTPEAVRTMVKRAHIPHMKIGRRVQFDREKIDRWMERHSRRGAQL